MKVVSPLLDIVLSKKWRTRISHVSAILQGKPYGFLIDPSYSEDGLITFHLSGFISDPKFARAYAAGMTTGALRTHPTDIRWRVYVACWAANWAKHLNGDFVECGVSLGLLSRAVVEYIDFKTLDRKFWLFDTFEGIPDGFLTDEEEQRGINNSLFGYEDCYDAVRSTFSEFRNVEIVRGIVPQSLTEHSIERVAYLSIDMNNAASEIAAAEYFWDKLVPGAVVVLDDYAYSRQFLAQHTAFNEFCERRGVSVLALPTGQGLIFKP